MRIDVMRPVGPPSSAINRYLLEIEASGWYSNFGPLVRQLESRIASLLCVDPNQVVSFSSATQGLIGALQCLSFDRLGIPDFTFTATVAAGMQSGASVELWDVSEETWILAETPTDLNRLEVWPFGSVPSSDSIETAPRLVDAAASLGTAIRDGIVIADKSIVVFSLHGTKVFGAGEGAVAVIGNHALATEIRKWTNFGFSGDRQSAFLGSNAKMSEYGAAVALAALDGADQELAQWEAVNSLAREISLKLGVAPPAEILRATSPYWIMDFHEPHLRERVRNHLEAVGIETRVWWTSCGEMKAYAGRVHSTVKNSQKLQSTTLGLPMSRFQTILEFEQIHEALSSVLEE